VTVDSSVPARERRAPYSLAALTLLIVLASIEVIGRVGLLVVPSLIGMPNRTASAILREQTERIGRLLAPDSLRREEIDPELGWHYRARYGRGLDVINGQGTRNARSYASSPPRDAIRVAVFGDSFVYGNEVGTADSWPAQLEAIDPQLEVPNYGVGGYGADQALLRYHRDGMKLHPEVVVLGFTPDDLRRLVNVYRRFIDDREWPLAKPRFVLDEQGGLQLIPSPLPTAKDYERLRAQPTLVRELGRHDAWYAPEIYQNPLFDWSGAVRLGSLIAVRLRQHFLGRNRLVDGGVFNTQAEAFRIQEVIFRQFAADVTRNGAHPLIVFLPDAGSVALARAGRPTLYAPLAAALRQNGIDYVDVAPGFVARGHEQWKSYFMPGGHYSRLGNAIVAATLATTLRARAASDVGTR
jgi:GDSL-like lipase/acylhydrolase family protein